VDYDQGKDYEENIKKLKYLAEHLKDEIKVILIFFIAAQALKALINFSFYSVKLYF